MVYMWISLKQSIDYTVIQKVFGRSPVNISMVISNSIQSLHIFCELIFLDQFSPNEKYFTIQAREITYIN